jgi:hypothetical protein
MSAVDLADSRRSRRAEGLVILVATAIAFVSATWHAGSWNDGSRLATVECLVDRHTLAIDESVFVVPASEDTAHRSPYAAYEPDMTKLLRVGTKDKLRIDGHYYSDKSPVPALLMALLYQVLQWLTGLRAATQPEAFCWAMTLLSSGLPYVVAVWAVFRMGRLVQLPMSTQILLAGSFALATLAPVYARAVNGHILLLGVAAVLMWALARLGAESGTRPSWALLAGLGTLAGFGYSVDLGTGPPMFACALTLVAWRCRSMRGVGLFLLAALPWLALHHAVNYAVGGTFKPANAVPEHFLWEGCPFNAQNMTGTWKHAGVGDFLVYALSLLFGKHGFVGHNMPLFLSLPALVLLLWRRGRELPELLFAGCWCGGTWLAYSLLSNNHSGMNCSVRWFVPLLAPGYYVLAIALRDQPAWRDDFLILSGWGMVLVALAWWRGPWVGTMVPGYWPIEVLALMSWLGYRYWARGPLKKPNAASGSIPVAASQCSLLFVDVNR